MTQEAALARLRAVLVGVGGTILYIFVAGALVLLATAAIARAWPAAGGLPGQVTLPALVLQGVTQTIGFLGATWLVGTKVLGLDARALRLAWPAGAGRWAARLFVTGAALVVVAMLAATVLGGARWRHDAGGAGGYVAGVATWTLALLLPAFSEEVAVRGVPLAALERPLGRPAAILLTSAGFALAHAANPSVTPLALVHIGLAGIFLALACLLPGGLWTSTAAHLGWNAALMALESPVSGMPLADLPLLGYDAGGPAWLTGGAFGVEGGVLGGAALLAGAGLTWNWLRRKDLGIT